MWTTMTALLEHQQAAITKIQPIRVGGLFMEMGTGKTRAAIELACQRQHRIDHVVWICPVSVKETILQEWRKHTSLSEEQIHVFDNQTSDRTLQALRVAVYIAGIESISGSQRIILAVNQLVTARSFVVLDESSYIKGHHAKRTQRLTTIATRARYRLILTGTPLSQGVEDLFAQMRFLSPKILGYRSFYSFAANHLEYSLTNKGMIVRAHNTGLLAAKIAPYVYQVTKAECLSLPQKLYERRYAKLSHQQWLAYEQAKHELLMSLPNEDISVYDIFRLFTALQQIVCGYWNHPKRGMITYDHRRLETLDSIVADIPAGQRVIIWAKYRYCIDELVRHLDPVSVARHDGQLGERQRQHELERFRRGEARFFVATPATGGHGLTLNEAHYVVYYTNEFKYANRVQSEDRCHRIGQQERVTYIDIVASGTIDERIQQALARKENLIDSFKRKLDTIKKDRPAEIKKKLATLVAEL